jgi:hypothetical protein
MDPPEIKAALDKLGLTPQEAARLFRHDRRTVQRWIYDERGCCIYCWPRKSRHATSRSPRRNSENGSVPSGNAATDRARINQWGREMAPFSHQPNRGPETMMKWFVMEHRSGEFSGLALAPVKRRDGITQTFDTQDAAVRAAKRRMSLPHISYTVEAIDCSPSPLLFGEMR